MRPAVQFVIRQSGRLAFLFFVFALMNGGYVGKGLWQGSGLYGSVFEPGYLGRQPHFVSVWAALVEMLAFAALACVLLGISLRRKRTNPSRCEPQTLVSPYRRRERKAYRIPASWRRG